MTKLRVATDLPLTEDLVTSTLVVYGGKGMGKTNLGKVILEELSRARLRWSALDPMGVLWGIRYSVDGKGPGVECLILGGPHGDIPIEPTGGAVVADLVVDESANVIIDFSRKPNGESWSVGEKIRFVTDYGRRLFQRQGGLLNGHRREPIFQLIDEAARFIPQMIRAGQPDLAKCQSIWATIVEEGRNIGLGVGLLTQRSARLNKDVAELADIMLAFRTVGPNSINAVMDWLGEHIPKEKIKSTIETVRSLPIGSCLAVSPGWLQYEGIAHIRAATTFDSSATPKPGEKAKRVRGAGARPDLGKYAERMKETIERAKNDDPKALKQKITQLESDLKKAKAPVASAAPDPDVIRKIVEGEISDFLATAKVDIGGVLATKLRAIEAQLGGQLKYLTDFAVVLENPSNWKLGGLSGAGTKAVHEAAKLKPKTSNAVRLQLVKPPNEDARVEYVDVDASSVKAAEQNVLDAIAWFESIGIYEPSQIAVGFMAGYAPTGGAYAKIKADLRKKDLVSYPGGGKIELTEYGRALATAADRAHTLAELHRAVIERLDVAEGKLLDTLLAHYPNSLSHDELAAAAGYSDTGGAYAKAKGRLRKFGLAQYSKPGHICADAVLFPKELS